MRKLLRFVIGGQGLYYIATGVWPLISYATFELVTGPKTDDWLVRTVGALAIAIGCALLAGSLRRDPEIETLVLSAASAAAFATVDIVFALGGRISTIYLADAAAEIVILIIVLAVGLAR